MLSESCWSASSPEADPGPSAGPAFTPVWHHVAPGLPVHSCVLGHRPSLLKSLQRPHLEAWGSMPGKTGFDTVWRKLLSQLCRGLMFPA